MKVTFSFSKDGLDVTFRNTSREVPDGSTYLWDFGDYTATVSDMNPTHTYDQEGFYLVKLTITPPDSSGVEATSTSMTVGLSLLVKTTLSDSIYNLFDLRIPDNMVSLLTDTDRQMYIQKWQLFLYDLVPSEVTLENAENEFAWEALENQLVLEAACYDWTVVTAIALMQSLGTTISEDSSSTDGDSDQAAGQEVKKIVTGPTEVEFFASATSGDSASSIFKSLTSALSPGGIIDLMRQNLCMLAKRLRVALYICSNNYRVVTPNKVNVRNPGLLGGPNPTFPLTGASNKPTSKG